MPAPASTSAIIANRKTDMTAWRPVCQATRAWVFNARGSRRQAASASAPAISQLPACKKGFQAGRSAKGWMSAQAPSA
ncbi:hypothetical protein D9M68_990480 [compost metagenome]